jgi:hypothetical protein
MAMINNTKANASLSVQLQNRKIGFARRIETRAAYFLTDALDHADQQAAEKGAGQTADSTTPAPAHFYGPSLPMKRKRLICA